MTPDAALDALLAHHRKIDAMEGVLGLLAWDQETQMPPKGAAQRAEQRGAVAGALHALRTDPRIGDWLADAEAGGHPAPVRADLAEARRGWERAAKAPEALAVALARETSAAHVIWAAAKAAGDPAAFVPALGGVLTLRREEAAAVAEGTDLSPYDALLQDYEPGARAEALAPMFARLREGVVDLLGRCEGARRAPGLIGDFPAPSQMALARRLATVCGYDWEAGRLDLAVHPFCAGSFGDVRISSRVADADPLENAYAVMHETGHALYEQGLPEDLRGRPTGTHASMGLHESQSRFWENHVGRSRPAAPWMLGELRAAFGAIGIDDPEALFRAVNRVEDGFVRTAADELQYDLHILMRFDLERALVAGDLAPEDLEGAWNDRFEADFGRRPPHPGLGWLQDVHWSEGLIGYFPTYTLGNVAAAALAAAMRRDLPEVEAGWSEGDFAPALGWMREKVHARARSVPAGEILSDACGGPVDEGPLLAHLEAKFAD